MRPKTISCRVPPPRSIHPHRVISAIRVRRAQPAILQTRLIISLQTAIIGILFPSGRHLISISNCLDCPRDVAAISSHLSIAPLENLKKNVGSLLKNKNYLQFIKLLYYLFSYYLFMFRRIYSFETYTECKIFLI